MLTIMCYIFGLFMYEMAKTSPMWGDTEELEVWFGGMVKSMVTMLEIATHNGGFIARALANEYLGSWVLIVLLFFICVASLGILHLIIGVLLTSTLKLAKAGSERGLLLLLLSLLV